MAGIERTLKDGIRYRPARVLKVLGPLWLALVPVVLCAQNPQRGTDKTQDLTSLSLDELAQVEVMTVSRRPEKYWRVAASVTVLTQEDIRRSGATSIPEALRLVPGVQVARVDSNKWAIGVRGFASRLSRSILVLVDGRSVYTPLFAGVYWEVQDVLLEDIDRIEVVRGPGGALWGANAVQGIINIITKSAQDTQGSLLTVGGGSYEQGFLGFRYGGKTKAGRAFRVYGKFFNRDSFFHTTSGDFDDWRMGQTGFRTDWGTPKRGLWTFQGDLYAGRTGQRTTISNLAPPFRQTVEQDANLSGGNFQGRWRRELGETSEMSFHFYYDRTNRSEPSFRENRDTLNFDFQHGTSLTARQTLTWGFEYRLSTGKVTGVPTVAFIPPRRTDNLLTAFIIDEIQIVKDRLGLHVGSKFEHNGYTGFEFQPSVRLLWNPTKKQTVWASFTRGVRVPSRLEHDLIVTTSLDPALPIFARFLANRNFRSEKVFAYESGYRVEARDHVLISASLFFNNDRDFLSIEPGTPFQETTPPPPPRTVSPFVFQNEVRGQSYGTELRCEWLVGNRLRLSGSYSFLRLDLKAAPTSQDANTARSAEGSSPHHQVAFRSLLNLGSNLELDLVFRYVDRLPTQGIARYSSLDTRIGWQATDKLELSVVGQNLLQNRHAEFGGGSAGRSEVERSGYGKVTWRW